MTMMMIMMTMMMMMMVMMMSMVKVAPPSNRTFTRGGVKAELARPTPSLSKEEQEKQDEVCDVA